MTYTSFATRCTAASLALSLWACSGQTTQEAPVQDTTANPDAAWYDPKPEFTLEQRVSILADSVQSLEKQLFNTEAAKLKDVGALLDELARWPKAPASKVAKAKELLKSAQATAFAKDKIAVKEHVLAHDEALDALMNSLRDLAETGGFDQNQRAVVLYDAVMAADAQDFQLRQSYNSYADEWNELLNTKRADVEALGEKFKSLQPVPVVWSEKYEAVQ